MALHHIFMKNTYKVYNIFFKIATNPFAKQEDFDYHIKVIINKYLKILEMILIKALSFLSFFRYFSQSVGLNIVIDYKLAKKGF